MVKLYCLRINENEIKTTDYKELSRFFRANAKDSNSIVKTIVEVPEARLKHVIENVPVLDLLEWKKKKEGIPSNRLYG